MPSKKLDPELLDEVQRRIDKATIATLNPEQAKGIYQNQSLRLRNKKQSQLQNQHSVLYKAPRIHLLNHPRLGVWLGLCSLTLFLLMLLSGFLFLALS